MDSNVAENIEDYSKDCSEEEVTRAALIEALIFANGEPVSSTQLSEIAGITEEEVAQSVSIIQTKFERPDAGIELVEVAGKFQFRTKALFAPFLQQLKSDRPRKLSPPALETLAIIAYRQPIVKSDVEKLRGVDATPTLKTLLERGLIKIVGHQSTVGQPALYGTTDEFLALFGLSSLGELPTLRDLKELESDPGEVEYPEDQASAQEESVVVEAEAI
jgi:segregation and condensation protein B